MKAQVLSIIGRHKQGHRPGSPCRNMLVSIQTEVEALKDPWAELRKFVAHQRAEVERFGNTKATTEADYGEAHGMEVMLDRLTDELDRLDATEGKR